MPFFSFISRPVQHTRDRRARHRPSDDRRTWGIDGTRNRARFTKLQASDEDAPTDILNLMYNTGMASLLAVDVGLRTGLARYGDDGRLCWYRSHNFGARARLKRAIPAILREQPDMAWLMVEGGTYADLWTGAATRAGVRVVQIAAETWRRDLLLAREQRNAAVAKANAEELARRVIAWSAAPAPTSLRHDAAEAILIGLWGVIHAGWLDGPPAALRS